MKKRFKQASQALRAQPRALSGFAVLLGVFWVAAWLEADAQVQALRAEATRLAIEVARLSALSSEVFWPDIRDQSRLRLAEFHARTWRGESEGHIQAAFQDWMRESLSAAGIKPRELVVSQPALAAEPGTEEGGLWPAEMRLVRARVVMDFAPQPLAEWFATLARQERWFRLDRLKIVNYARNPTVELEITALYVIGVTEGL